MHEASQSTLALSITASPSSDSLFKGGLTTSKIISPDTRRSPSPNGRFEAFVSEVDQQRVKLYKEQKDSLVQLVLKEATNRNENYRARIKNFFESNYLQMTVRELLNGIRTIDEGINPERLLRSFSFGTSSNQSLLDEETSSKVRDEKYINSSQTLNGSSLIGRLDIAQAPNKGLSVEQSQSNSEARKIERDCREDKAKKSNFDLTNKLSKENEALKGNINGTKSDLDRIDVELFRIHYYIKSKQALIDGMEKLKQDESNKLEKEYKSLEVKKDLNESALSTLSVSISEKEKIIRAHLQERSDWESKKEEIEKNLNSLKAKSDKESKDKGTQLKNLVAKNNDQQTNLSQTNNRLTALIRKVGHEALSKMRDELALTTYSARAVEKEAEGLESSTSDYKKHSQERKIQLEKEIAELIKDLDKLEAENKEVIRTKNLQIYQLGKQKDEMLSELEGIEYIGKNAYLSLEKKVEIEEKGKQELKGIKSEKKKTHEKSFRELLKKTTEISERISNSTISKDKQEIELIKDRNTEIIENLKRKLEFKRSERDNLLAKNKTIKEAFNLEYVKKANFGFQANRKYTDNEGSLQRNINIQKQERTKLGKETENIRENCEKLKAVKDSLSEVYEVLADVNHNKELDIRLRQEMKLAKDSSILMVRESKEKRTLEEKLKKDIAKQAVRINELQAKEAELLEDLNVLNTGELPKKKKFLGLF